RKSRPAVTNPRISDLTRVDTTRSTSPRTHPVNEAAAPTTVAAAASPCPLDKMPPISGRSYLLFAEPSALTEERGGVVVAAFGHQLELAHGIRQRHPADILPPQRHHLAVLARMRGVGGVDPEPGGQHPVVGRRRAAALHVTKHGHPDLFVDPLFHLEAELRSHTGKTLMAELVNTALAQRNRTRDWFGAFGHHADKVRIPALEAPFD